ncbi:MAG: DUF4440 domain-containing protein [Pyrinomonadaceae bacterium]
MKRLLTATLAFAASAILFGCGEPAANSGNANKTANLSANTANTAKPADTAAVEAELKKFVSDFEAALNKNDADAVAKFYDDSYTLIDQNGDLQTKASRLEQIRSGKIKWEGLKFNDIKVRCHPAGDGAFVYAGATGKTVMDGKSEDRNSMVTWVMHKQPDGWKLIHAQITDKKAGAARADGDKPAAANTAAANK